MAKSLLKLLISILICIPINIYSQKNNISLRTGYSYYQGIHLSANYFYTENLNLGIGIGSHFGLPPLEGDNHYNFTIENNLQFGKQNRFNAKPWIFGQQVMYWIQGSESETWKILSISPTIGRVFAISSRVGLAFEVGPAFNLVVDVEREEPYDEAGWMWPILYNYRVQLIYNIEL